MSGSFFVFDGMDGAGKSTAVAALADHLQSMGYVVRLTREPGGSPLAESIRECMLHDWADGMPIQTELLLVFAARAAHMQQTVLPALARGEVVLCDRFIDSSYVYQGCLGGVDSAWIDMLVSRSVSRLPDKTLIFDLTVDQACARMSQRGRENRFDRHGAERLEKVRAAFQERATKNRETHQTIDASADIAAIQQQLLQAITPHLPSLNIQQ